MATPSLQNLFGLLTPKKPPKTATSITPTHQPQNKQQVLTVPTYREHLTALRDNRMSQSSQELLKAMFKQDPDVSAAVGSFLTLSDTRLTMVVRNHEGQIDLNASKQLPALVRALTAPTDYTAGFTFKPNLQMLSQELRYMLMLRGAIAGELVLDKKMIPNRIQHVDMASVEWLEPEPGVYKPQQRQPGKNAPVKLDIPSFFVAYHRRDPTSIYATSDFVSVINTAASRVQVINDLYRIMQITGFPRMDITVLEETVRENAPASVKDNPDPQAMIDWSSNLIGQVQAAFANLRSDESFVHTDAVEAKVLNDKNPGAGLQIQEVIEVLNAQNQAALKTMATVIGRGSGAAGVASVEARIAAMNADQLNVPLKMFFDQAFTFLINVYGIQGYVDCSFAPAELRPSMELEAQRSLKSSRLRLDLSDGLITDEEYHMEVYGRLPPDGTPMLSGTGFANPEPLVDPTGSTSNADPLGRSQTGEGADMAKSNGQPGAKKPGGGRKAA